MRASRSGSTLVRSRIAYPLDCVTPMRFGRNGELPRCENEPALR